MRCAAQRVMSRHVRFSSRILPVLAALLGLSIGVAAADEASQGAPGRPAAELQRIALAALEACDPVIEFDPTTPDKPVVAVRFRPNAAKLALLEMSNILEYFANVMGRRIASPAGEAARA